MTWIVGVNSLFGQGILVSDLCVTFQRRSGEKFYRDCLQKIYPLGRCVIGGFAGSVQIGFGMIEFLRRQLAIAPDDQGWNMDIVANTWWPRCARKIFRSSPEEERKSGSQIIIGTVHPMKNMGDAPWARADIFRFSSPEFAAEKATSSQVLAIGSGSNVPAYMEAVKKACSEFIFHQMIMGGEIAQGRFVASVVEDSVKHLPKSGVGAMFQVGVVSRDKGLIVNHEYDVYLPGQEKIEMRFPKIATNYAEFREIAAASGGLTASISC